MSVSFLSSSRSLLCSPTFPALTQTLSLPIETSWTLCFRVYHSFPITIFPEGPKFPLAVHSSAFFCGHQSCSDSSIPFLLLEATGSGLSIISALLGVKGKVASFSRLLDQQTHISHWSIRAASIVGHVLLCLPAAVSTADLHPSSCYVQWPGYKRQSQKA